MSNKTKPQLEIELKEAQVQIARLEEALKEAIATGVRYRLVADHTVDVIWVMDPIAAKFTYVSPSVEKLRGYTPEEVMEEPVNEALTPDSLKMVSESLQKNLPAFLAKGIGTESFINEVDQPCKNGSIVHTEVTTTYLFNKRGEVEIVGVSRDITERKQTGTGLGLALVQQLVDLHGGSVEVESALGQGSRFIVTLPYLPGGTEQKDDISDITSQIKQTLIVEDSTIDADRLSRFLKLLGIRSTVQDTAAGVVERVAALQPGVVLLDINLPDASGWNVLEQLKQNEATRNVAVVITSVVDDRERTNRMGAAGYLLKPFTLEELRLTLSRTPKPEGKRQDTALDRFSRGTSWYCYDRG